MGIIAFHLKNPLEGYRRLTFMMLDADIVAVSPTSVWRVLGQAGLLSKWNGKTSKKATGFEQPLAAHQHWHVTLMTERRLHFQQNRNTLRFTQVWISRRRHFDAFAARVPSAPVS